MLRIDCSAGVCDEFTWIPTIQTYKNNNSLSLTLLFFWWYLEFYCTIVNPYDI